MCENAKNDGSSVMTVHISLEADDLGAEALDEEIGALTGSLTAKQQEFITHYLRHRNATSAYHADHAHHTRGSRACLVDDCQHPHQRRRQGACAALPALSRYEP